MNNLDKLSCNLINYLVPGIVFLVLANYLIDIRYDEDLLLKSFDPM